ncbi:MAG: apiosidase-like domain-containing protein [Pirellulaceae bacterium]
MKRTLTSLALALVLLLAASAGGAEQWVVSETSFTSAKKYDNPFVDVEVDVVFKQGEQQWKVPAYWAGGDTWTVRFAPPLQGDYTYRVTCSDPANKGLHGNEQSLPVTAYTGDHPLLKHGFIQVSANGRHFEHADGTPFFWLGDTWWKCLCKRMTWDGFQELTADRQAKGFNVVQIVCGPYPDEGFLEPRMANEGGLPYESVKFEKVNPEYFNYADRRLQHLVEAGIAPAIVGAWGRGDCNSMEAIGVVGLKRHWRYLVARYSAYPVFWILAGEIPEETKWGQGPWAELAIYLRGIDPYHRPLTCHTGHGRRGVQGDSHVIDFDMVGGNHDERVAVDPKTVAIVSSAYSKDPPMPVLVGETCYEGHMQQGFGDVQRRMFWGRILSGAAGHTYGAAGIWHASVEGDPGCASSAFGGTKVYDWTTWKEGMNYPGATQLGIGKKLLEQYPWSRFEPHPEWTDGDSLAAGIPGEVRFIYQPRRGIYDWEGTVVKNLELGVTYHVFYFDPATGRRFDQGIVMYAGPTVPPFQGHAKPLLLEETFDKADAASWKDYGTPTRRENSRLVGGKGLVTVAEKISELNLMASVDANSDAEAGIILRFHDTDHYLVALYSPLLKAIFLHDRKNGQWGEMLGSVDVSEIGPRIQLVAAACGEFAALVLTDGQRTYATPVVKVGNTTAGKTGLWMFQIGERQEFGRFAVSATPFDPPRDSLEAGLPGVIRTDEYHASDLPSPQDWILVLERCKP